MDFIYLFRVLSKKKWIILGSFVLAATIAYILTANQPKRYRSVAQVSTGFTVSDQVRVDESFSIYEAESKFNNAIVTIHSPSVMSLLSYDVMLHDLKSKEPFRKPEVNITPTDKAAAMRILQAKLDNMTMLNASVPEEKKVLQLLKNYEYDYPTLKENINVFRFERSDYIQIDNASENPDLSAFLVNRTYDQFLNYYKRLRSSTSSESLDTLRAIVEKRREVMDSKNEELKVKGIVINMDDPNGTTFTQIADFETRIQDERRNLTQLNAELQKVNQRLRAAGSRTTTGPARNDDVVIARELMNNAFRAHKANPEDATLKADYEKKRDDYQKKIVNAGGSLSRQRTPDDPEELSVKKAEIEVDIQAANQMIGTLQRQVNQLRGTIVNDASKSASVQSLIKEAEQASTEYLDAKKRYDDALNVNSTAASNYKQVLFGHPAIEPEPSKRGLLVGMAGMAALVTTLLIIIGLTYLDSSIKTPLIFQKTVNLKLISMVNFMDLKRKSLAAVIARRDTGDDDEEKQRNNVFRESLRKLRFEVERSGKKIFLFTSTQKGQGKTTLIQALSYSLSLSKKKILIIDTNFCNNDLTVQLEAQPVLEKMVPYTSNGKSMLEQVKSFSKNISAGTVFAIGSEGGDYTPSEILPKDNILVHLHSLTEEFDYIFLEGPPLNDFSDSKELAQYVDGVIAVFSAKHIIKQIDKESISFFRELNGKFTGSILNMVDLKDVNVT